MTDTRQPPAAPPAPLAAFPTASPPTAPGPPPQGPLGEEQLGARSEPRRGVYGISVAAELVGMGAQTLRLYETRGLLDPDRTPGGTRRYSPDDLDRVRRIGQLLTDGLNLAGIAMVLDLQDENTLLRGSGPLSERPTEPLSRPISRGATELPS